MALKGFNDSSDSSYFDSHDDSDNSRPSEDYGNSDH